MLLDSSATHIESRVPRALNVIGVRAVEEVRATAVVGDTVPRGLDGLPGGVHVDKIATALGLIRILDTALPVTTTPQAPGAP